MSLDFTEYIRRIKNSPSYNLAYHIWLEGFSSLDNRAYLDEGLVNTYLNLRLDKHKRFTPIANKGFLNGIKKIPKEERPRVINYPIDDNYNLVFALERDLCGEKLFYFDCLPGECRILPPYTFPYLEVRRSVDFSEAASPSKNVTDRNDYSGTFLEINRQSPDKIIESYRVMEEFLELTKGKYS